MTYRLILPSRGAGLLLHPLLASSLVHSVIRFIRHTSYSCLANETSRFPSDLYQFLYHLSHPRFFYFCQRSEALRCTQCIIRDSLEQRYRHILAVRRPVDDTKLCKYHLALPIGPEHRKLVRGRFKIFQPSSSKACEWSRM